MACFALLAFDDNNNAPGGEGEKRNPHPRQRQLIFTSLSPLFSPPSQSHSLTSQLLSRLVLLVSTDDAIINQRKERCSVFGFGFVSPCAARSSESNGDLVLSSLALPAPPPRPRRPMGEA